jgi:hypothetical protein
LGRKPSHQKRFNYYAVKGCYLPAEQIDEQVLQGLAFLNLTPNTLKSSIAKVIYTKRKDIGKLEIHLTLDETLGKLKLPPQAVLSMDQKTLILSISILSTNHFKRASKQADSIDSRDERTVDSRTFLSVALQNPMEARRKRSRHNPRRSIRKKKNTEVSRLDASVPSDY